MQVVVRVHNIISNMIAPYEPGHVQVFITDHQRTPEAKVRIVIERFPNDPFEDYIAKLLPLREEIFKTAHKAAEYFKEKLK